MARNTFISRTPTTGNIDYISRVNDTIKKGGTIDPNSETFQNALAQYNEGLIRGSTARLEVPAGFCGFIDPDSGEFRVEPDPLVSTLRSSTLYPDNAQNANDVPPLPITPYPVDLCLSQGLPGSYEYTTGTCGEESEDGDNECSGISWFSGESNSVSESEGEGSEGDDDDNACGDGAGINSNLGLASADELTILASSELDRYPDLRPAVEAIVRDFLRNPQGFPGEGFCGLPSSEFGSISNRAPTINDDGTLSFTVYNDVNINQCSGDVWFYKSGVVVYISYNPEEEEVIEGGYAEANQNSYPVKQ